MPAHMKSALAATSQSISPVNGKLALGAWQGMFPWEHRHYRGALEASVNAIGT